MSWLRRHLRDQPWARALARALDKPARRTPDADDRSGNVLFLTYHDMRARETASFTRQIDRLHEFGGFVGMDAALAHLENGTGTRVCLTFDDGRRGAFDHAVPILQRLGVPATFFLVPDWIDQRRPDIIGWDDCRALLRAGLGVGSHSLNHHRLVDLDPATVAADLERSRARIEAETKTPCRHFACPYGQPTTDFDPARDPALARNAGYHSFLTTIQRRARRGADPWSLPRVRMEPGWADAELRYAQTR